MSNVDAASNRRENLLAVLKTRLIACVSCEEQARFIAPDGLMCPDHAIMATMRQPDSEELWIPIPIESHP